MRAEIDSVIRVESLSADVRRRILSDLTAINTDKERALSEHVQGAQWMPDYVTLWREKKDELILPRGVAHRLEQIASEHEEEVVWESSMTLLPPSEHLFRDWPVAELRDYQIPARDAMLDWAQGIVKAPTRSGKTRAALEFIRWAGQKTIVVVGKAALARQWQEFARDVYGYETGYIGEGTWDVRDLTIALWQTLWARMQDVDDDFWKQFGCLIGDEVHHAGAVSLSELVAMFPAFFRIGLSATPKWSETSWPIVRALFGPIIYETSTTQVGDKLLTPSVQVVESDFEHEYVPTHYEDRRRVQNNYTEIMAALVTDPARNDLVASIARREAQEGHHVLVVTRRREHVKQLVDRLEKVLRLGSRLNVLTGSQSGDDARRIAKMIDQATNGTVLVSTVAEEALDIPRLDRLIMSFPLRKLPLVEQQVGRIVGAVEGKENAVVYDVSDPGVGPLVSQRRDRERFYARKGWDVAKYDLEKLLTQR